MAGVLVSGLLKELAIKIATVSVNDDVNRVTHPLHVNSDDASDVETTAGRLAVVLSVHAISGVELMTDHHSVAAVLKNLQNFIHVFKDVPKKVELANFFVRTKLLTVCLVFLLF